MQKNYRLKTRLLFLLLVCGLSVFAQKNTSSPYSRYGIGDLVSQGKGRSVAMGGAGIALNSSLMLNGLNPASYAALDSMSFLYEIGLRAHFAEYSASSTDQVHSDKDINFDYFNIAWPVTKWWRMGLGVLPKSNVGYEFTLIDKTDNVGDYYQQFIGKGGVNKVNFTHAFIPFKNFYLGVNMSYLFGEIENDKRVFLTDANSMNYYEDETLTVSDVMFDFGLQYSAALSKNHKLSFGVVYNAKTAIKTDYEDLKTTRNLSGLENNLVDTIIKSSFDYPMTWGIGLAYHYKDKLTMAVDYTNSLWSKSSFVNDDISFNDNQNFAAGLEFTPDKGSLRNYFKVVTYRFGGYYKNTYLQINGERIKDYGISFGVGLPLRRTVTNLNIAFEIGQKGTVENNLVKEKYAKVSVSFSMFSRWFYKQKYE